MTTFHIIHILVGAWLIVSPYLGVFDNMQNGMLWNNVIIGAVVALYNAWYLFARNNVDVRQDR